MSSNASLHIQPLLSPSTTNILVTGATGFLASHIITEALGLGYRVRGTVRDSARGKATEKLYGNHPLYSTVVVADFAAGSPEIDEAVKGIDSIIHVASDVSFSPDPNKVITPVVHGVLNVLKAAAKTPSVKRFTLTSSSSAVISQLPGGTPESTLTVNSWNEDSVEKAWAKPGPEGWPADQSAHVYAASKVEGEQAMWNFMKEENPSFVANAILPNINIGRILPGGTPGASGWAVVSLFQNQVFPPVQPMHYINAGDTAKLHLIAAVMDEDLTSQRIFAFADQFNWNDVLDSIARVRPEKVMTVGKDPTLGRDLTKVPKQLGADLLRKWYGQDGYKSLDESVRENLDGVE